MSVTTTADEKIEETKAAIDTAIKALAEILIVECWGYDEYNTDYDEMLKNTFDTLRILKDNMKRGRV